MINLPSLPVVLTCTCCLLAFVVGTTFRFTNLWDILLASDFYQKALLVGFTV
jgi:hypothetical protein